MPGDYSQIPSWTRAFRKVMRISMPSPHYEVINRDGDVLYVGHVAHADRVEEWGTDFTVEKALATYELDELYAFFLDEGVPHEFSVYDELDCLFTS